MNEREQGFTLVELLVVLALAAMVTTAMYQVMFSATRGSRAAENAIRVTEEARLGFNRMVRDTREAQSIGNATATSFEVRIDFNGDNAISDAPIGGELGSYEKLTFTFNAGAQTVTVTCCTATTPVTETLMTGVTCVLRSDNTCEPAFTFSSSRLELDTDGDGVAEPTELDQSQAVGNQNGTLDGAELASIDRVTFALRVRQGQAANDFYADAQLRNKR